MHATHPHPHPRRAVVAAVAALALALLALMPATVADMSFSTGAGDRSTPTEAPAFAPTTTREEPKWQDNPFAWPLLQVPGERAR